MNAAAATPRPLSEADRSRVAAMRARVLAEAPGMADVVREMHAAGLIDGWRAVTYLGPPRDPPNAVCGPFLNGDEIMRRNEK